MGEHTPGPWTADGLNVRTGTGATLATVTGPLAPWEVGQPEADARLIASAPDLLEFVQWTVNFYEMMEKIGDLSEDERPILEAARNAIAKATGKET